MFKFNIVDTMYDTGLKSEMESVQDIVKRTLSKELLKFHTLSFEGLSEIQKISEDNKYSMEYRRAEILKKETALNGNLEQIWVEVLKTIEMLRRKAGNKYDDKQLEVYYKNLSTVNTFGLDTEEKLLESFRAAMSKNDILLAKLIMRGAEGKCKCIGTYSEMMTRYIDSEYGKIESGVEKIVDILEGLKGSLMSPGTIGTKNIGDALILSIIRQACNAVGLSGD